MKKVLISAFMPFNNNANNYSVEVLNYINDEFFKIDRKIINVVYDMSFLELEQENLNKYDLIIALGEARSRNELMVENKAKNISSCSLKDNSGVIKCNEIIDNNAPLELESNINFDLFKDLSIISYDAGKFVCNNLYFHLLLKYPGKSLFIHIPECNNNKEEYQKHANTICQIIRRILS